MAASAAAAGSFPGLCPSYAVICSFLERYGALLDLPELTFTQLERYLQDTSSVPKLLVDLHVKLLRKIGKSVSADRWEKHLVKICQEFNTTWSWELEKKGYRDMTVESKTGILKYLCESQFDDNVKFKTAINEEDADKMRLQPIGRDKDGQMYWFQLDQDHNVRVYVEEQDDLDGSSWKCIVRERNDLAEILALLKTQIDPALLTKKDGEDEVKKEENADTSDDEEEKASKENLGVAVSPKTESQEKDSRDEDSKPAVRDAKSPSSDVKDNQPESESAARSERPDAHDGVTVTTQVIKEEPMEVLESKEGTDTSAKEPLPEKPPVALPTEQDEESKKKSAEDLQRAMKSDQQAKMPLKKREMKLSEDFDSNSGGGGIIVRNPSVSQVKEPLKLDEANKEGSGKEANKEGSGKEANKEGSGKEAKRDHVNGDAQHAAEKGFNNGLRESAEEMQKDSADGREQPTKAAGHESESVESKENKTSNLPTDKDGLKCKPKEVANVSKINEPYLQNKITAAKAEKQSSDAPVAAKESVLKKAASLKAGILPSSKDATNTPDNSFDDKEPDKLNKSKETDAMVASVDEKTSTSTETNKTATSMKSQKPEESEGADSSVESTKVKSDAREETEKTVVSKETDSTEVKGMVKPALTKGTEKLSDCKTTALIKEPGRTVLGTDKPDCSKLTETPAVVKEKETPSSDNGSTKAGGPKETDTSSVIKKTEMVKRSKGTEDLDGGKKTSTSSVIKKADKPPAKKDTETRESRKETKESSVIKKIEKLEESKPTEKCDGSKDTKTSVITKETQSSTGKDKKVFTGEKEKPGLEKDSKKTVSGKNKEVKTVAEVTGANVEPKEVEKTTHPQLAKPKYVEKLATSDSKTATKETNKPSRPDKEKPDACTETEKLAETKPDTAMETLAASVKDAHQSPSPKTSASLEGSKEEPMEISSETSTDEKIRRGGNQEPQKVEKSQTTLGSKSVKKQTPMDCKEPSKSESAKKQTPMDRKEPSKSESAKKQTPMDRKEPSKSESAKKQTPMDRKEPSKSESAKKQTPMDRKEPSESESDKKQTPMDCKEPSTSESAKEQTPIDCKEPSKEQTTKKDGLEQTASLALTVSEKDKSQNKEMERDAKIKCPGTEDGKEANQTEKDGKSSAEAEKSSDTKTNKVSEEEKLNDKADEDMEKDEEASAEKGDKGSSEVQEEGIRLKIKIPAHQRRAEIQREERGDSESDTGEGRSLRRSPRICRPTPKVVEIQDRRLERKQATHQMEKSEEGEKEEEDEEDEDEEDEKAVQRKPREKVDQEGQAKTKGRRRRKTRWSNTRTRRKKKGSDEDDDDESSDYDDSEEEEDDSDEDYRVERNRKRRNRTSERRISDDSTSSDDDLPPNDDPCKHCGLPNHPELILLCDSCDSGYHTACLRPPLMIIPDGEWFCPPCQHKQLCDKLEEQLQNLDAALKKRDRAERRKERLVYVGISVENIITPSVEAEEEKEEEVVKVKKEVKKSKSWGRRSTRAKKSISYRFDEFDEAIEEAIEEDIKEAEGGGAGRGKDMANITGHRGKDMSTILQGGGGKENGRPPRPNAGQRRKKRRRLNDLDSDSTMEEEESEDEFRLSDSTEEEEFVVSENDAESDAEVDSDFGSTASGPRHRSARTRRPAKRRKTARQPPRRRRRPRGYSDDEEEETDEDEDEDEMVTEGSSEFSDSDLDMSRRRSRRSKKQQVNYCETSESEGSRAGTNRDKPRPRRRLASSDSEASLSRGSDNEERRGKRRADSSEEESRQRRRRLSLKRRRASEDDDDDSDESEEEEERPVRKRVNRIDSDDDEEEEEEEEEDKEAKKGGAEKEDEEGGVLGKGGAHPLDYSLAEMPPANGQSPLKALEGLMGRPGAGGAIGAPDLMAHLGPKNAAPAVAVAPNGLAAQEMAPQDDEEDDLLGVTDLVDYVCNSEQL